MAASNASRRAGSSQTFKSSPCGIATRLCRSRRLCRALTLAAVVQTFEHSTPVCDASNITLGTADATNKSSFSGGPYEWNAGGSPTLAAGTAPTAGYDYEVSGTTATASLVRAYGSAPGTTTGNSSFAGALLQIDDGADLLLKTSGTVTVNSLMLTGGVVEIDSITGGGTLAGTITLNSSTTSYLNADAGTSLSVTAPISGSGGVTIDGYDSLYASNSTTLYNNNTSPTYRADNPAAGTGTSITGTVIFSASNSYTGVTTLSGGILSLNNTNALAGGGSITFIGGTLQFSANNTNDYSTKIVSSTSSMTIDTNGQSVTFAGVLASSNTAGLTKTGNGTLFLSNTGSGGEYTGGVTLTPARSTSAGLTAWASLPPTPPSPSPSRATARCNSPPASMRSPPSMPTGRSPSPPRA